jgi:hypothetical protein
MKGDLEGCISDCDEALALDPGNLCAKATRDWAAGLKGTVSTRGR